MYILTFWCKLLCYHNGRIIQKDLREISSLQEAVVLRQFDYGYDLLARKNEAFGHDIETNVMTRAVPSGTFAVEHHLEDQIASIKSNTGYMRALKDGSIDFVAQNWSDWETVRLLTQDEIETLLFLVKCGLLVNNQKTLQEFNLLQSNHKEITFGEYSIDQRYLNGKNLCKGSSSQFTFYENWKPNRAAVYNPALFYAIFGTGDIITQFRLSLESLNKFGNYQGQLIILTNNDPDYMEKIAAGYGFHNVSIFMAEAFDSLDYVGSRISIISSGVLDDYQPLVYADADILFDKDINGFLKEALWINKISAQEEGFTLFKTSESVGSTLYSEDHYDLEDETYGFNAGLFSISSVRDFKWVFQAAYVCMKRYITEYGRNSIPFYDQSVLNYVFHKFGVYSSYPLTEKVRLWSENMALEGTGFIHFWPAPQKSEKMKAHMEKLLLEKNILNVENKELV